MVRSWESLRRQKQQRMVSYWMELEGKELRVTWLLHLLTWGPAKGGSLVRDCEV